MWRIQSEQVFKLATLILPPAAPHLSQQLCNIGHFSSTGFLHHETA
jgi:hypothetical protein